MKISQIEKTLGAPFSLHYHEEASSTNDIALQMAREGAAHGTLVVADFQSAGRGRRGDSWVAPAGTSVLVSLLLKSPAKLPPHHLAILSGVGVANGLRKLGVEAKIKWPNDIYVNDRKVAGILVETHEDSCVIGVGVNVRVPEESFPQDFRSRAGSLHTLECEVTREETLSAVITALYDAFSRVTGGSIVKVLYEWNTMNWFSRRKVRVSGPMGVVEGDGIFLDGHKLVFHVFKDYGVVAMPLSSKVELR